MSDALLSAEAARFRYPQHAVATGPFSLAVAEGELCLVSGASGTGKSTLARLLCGAIPHLYRGELHGRVCVDGVASDRLPLWRLSQTVGLVTQNPAAQLLASTVRAEVAFGLETLGLAGDAVRARTSAALAASGLERFAERDPRSLSGGEQQRLVLAAVMARRPRALVLDEPLSMLDTTAAAAVVRDLEALRDGGVAVVACEHRTAAFARLRQVRRMTLPGPTRGETAPPEPPAPIAGVRLQARRLRVEHGKRAVLRDVDLDLAGGQVVCLVGANGSGKTTLLRALAGLQPSSGHIDGWVDGRRMPPRLAMCFQNPDRQLFNATVRDELCFGRPTPDGEHYRRVLALLGLTEHEQTPPLLLSEGEKKRLGVAIMLMQPGLHGLCLDEPTLGQDDANRRALGGVVRRLAAAGFLCLAATHDHEWAASWADEVVELRDGRVHAVRPATDARAAACA